LDTPSCNFIITVKSCLVTFVDRSNGNSMFTLEILHNSLNNMIIDI